jgi:antitoxin ParD1/3/4
MPTRNVVLTDRQEALVGSLVESGRYQNASEVLREGLRLVEQREAEDAARLDALRRAVDIGIREIDEGQCEALSTRAQIAGYMDELDADRTGLFRGP